MCENLLKVILSNDLRENYTEFLKFCGIMNTFVDPALYLYLKLKNGTSSEKALRQNSSTHFIFRANINDDLSLREEKQFTSS